MKEILVATANKNKIYEIKDILKNLNFDIDIKSIDDFDIKEEPIEDGLTFEENALIKARYYHHLTHIPVIADDSGISIEYLNNYPGIHSARFLSGTSYPEKCNYILKLLEGVNNRNAHFDCVLAYIDENSNEKTYHGRIDGHIADRVRGVNGFGYDPIFCYGENDMTNAELPKNKKNEFSHRYLVIRKWVEDVKSK